VYFMSTVCGRPQGGVWGVGPCGQVEQGSKTLFFVDVINGWPPTINQMQARSARHPVIMLVTGLIVVACIYRVCSGEP